ncbi:MAG: cyclase family protein [Candidatus Promineifilaceae bacterium]
MPVIDISRKLKPGTAVWPGDTPYLLRQLLKIDAGDSVNLTTIKMSAHTGSHIDAPLHFADAGLSIDTLDLAVFWGDAQVVSVDNKSGPLNTDDFAGHDLSLAPRILVRSSASSPDQSIFPSAFVYPSPELADMLGELGIILYGTDSPSVDPEDSKTLDGHKALNQNGISILEWLDLGGAEDGLYELVALPLSIAGGDGSPVRAALRYIPQLPDRKR